MHLETIRKIIRKMISENNHSLHLLLLTFALWRSRDQLLHLHFESGPTFHKTKGTLVTKAKLENFGLNSGILQQITLLYSAMMQFDQKYDSNSDPNLV